MPKRASRLPELAVNPILVPKHPYEKPTLAHRETLGLSRIRIASGLLRGLWCNVIYISDLILSALKVYSP
jgi:hypothetical protein